MDDFQKKFFADFEEASKNMMPSKSKIALVILLNLGIFVFCVGVIAFAIKWIVSG